MDSATRVRITDLTGHAVVDVAPLAGGCIGAVWRVGLADGTNVVAKAGQTGSGLTVEGAMLTYLANESALPVPAVHHAADDLLVIEYIDTDGTLDEAAEVDAADHLAALHAITAPAYGFAQATLIGGLEQPNPQGDDWQRGFFAEHRLLYMAREAQRAGTLDAGAVARVEALAGRLDRWLERPGPPSLLHGDMWGGNVLGRGTPAGNRIAGFVDPAIYYGDAEIELAFATLFATFGLAFFARYEEHRPLAPGFFEARRDLYNLYPLLVHVRLFGAAYRPQIDDTLRRFGV